MSREAHDPFAPQPPVADLNEWLREQASPYPQHHGDPEAAARADAEDAADDATADVAPADPPPADEPPTETPAPTKAKSKRAPRRRRRAAPDLDAALKALDNKQ